jgi:tRNA (guanine-N7-)-methyltransferase
MSCAQRRSWENLHDRYCVPPGGVFDPEAAFGNGNPLTIEIGFGMGTATAELAERRREVNFLGIEVHRPGIGRLLWEIERRGLTNIRIIEDDAVEAIAGMINDESVDAFHVFFPDPWPKKRHHKRRLIRRPFTDLLAKKLRQGGRICMVTDWEDYSLQAMEELSITPGLVNSYGPGRFAPAQDWRPRTKFEQKGLQKNHRICELVFEKQGFSSCPA